MQDVAVGVKWGALLGGLLSAWVVVLILLNGGLVFRNRSGYEYSAGPIILLYLVGAPVAGGIVGAMRPLLRWKLGAVAVGIIAALPIGAAILIGRNGFTSWGPLETVSLAIFVVSFGGLGGLILREFAGREGEKPPAR